MSLVIEESRSKAEVYNGNGICQKKSKELLKEMGLPNGLLPLEDMEECGYVRETGFVWLRQKKKTEHKFEKIQKLVSYAPEVTAYVEPKRIKKLTGVKSKEFLLWMTICEIYVNDPPTGKISFQIPAGLSRSFPVAAFKVKEEEEEEVVVREDGGGQEVKEV